MMWLYTLVYLYLMVFEYAISCACNRSNHAKGETGDLEGMDFGDTTRTVKGQLPPFEDYGSVEFIIESDIDNTTRKYGIANIAPRRYYDDMTISESSPVKQIENFNFDFAPATAADQGSPIFTPSPRTPETTESTTSRTTSTTTTTITTTTTVPTTVATTAVTTESIKINTEEILTTQSPMNEQTPMSYCEKYKSVRQFEVRKMADVWKIEFYTIPSSLKCFRLHLKRLTPAEQQHYERFYGDFNDRVRWADCLLEIRSSDSRTVRKHFLQNSGCGVMDNIVIDHETADSNSPIVLRQENPDQWMIIKNLLLMRDCFTGDVVVFSRVPSIPSLQDIKNALVEFGESGTINGTRACQGYIKAWSKGKLSTKPLRYS